MTQSELTPKQLILLQGIADGKSTKEMSQEMLNGLETLKSYMCEILIRLRARNRTHAVAIALRKGLIE